MLQQTQVKTVIPYWERWLRELPDAAALAAAPEQRVLKLWEGLGYYTRARNLQKAAQQVVSTHGGRFPHAFDAILELPGVGRYTAGAIASIALNQPAPIVDGNVIRVLTRLFAIGENPRDKATNEQLWHLATQLVQAAARITNYELRIAGLVVSGACSALNQSLMELGATVCTPQSPQCLLCPVRPHCAAHREGRVGELPNLGPRTATTSREFHAFVVNCDGKLPVTQRPSGGVNAGLWEFPNVEVTGGPATPAESLHTLLQLRAHPEPWGEIKHTITRYRITQRVFRVTLSGKRLPERAGLHWLPPAELHRLPFTSAHKRILKRLTELAQ